MGRLKSFDYKSPYFYMVTLKRLKGLAAFSEIGPDGIIANEITRAFAAIIRGFHLKWRCCEEISPFAIMPDHLHLLIKIRDIPDRVALGRLVYPLEKALAEAYWRVVGADETAPSTTPGSASGSFASPTGSASGSFVCPIFEKEWHDWIVKKAGQLAAFRRYIRENAARAWNRRANAQYFGRVTEVEFLGRRWFAYGNRAILDLPVLTPFKGHRATAEGSAESSLFSRPRASARAGTRREKRNASAQAGACFSSRFTRRPLANPREKSSTNDVMRWLILQSMALLHRLDHRFDKGDLVFR